MLTIDASTDRRVIALNDLLTKALSHSKILVGTVDPTDSPEASYFCLKMDYIKDKLEDIVSTLDE